MKLKLTLLTAAGVLALGACSPNGGYDASRKTQPMAAADAVAPPVNATGAAYADGADTEDRALSYDGYALAERAHRFDTSVRDRRPDYAFRYEDEQPLAWRTADDYSRYAEPYEGGYRNYYYAPGSDHPYFVRDREYGYGYGPDGRVAAIYDSRGAQVSGDSFARIAAVAASVYLRARTVRSYGENDRYRVAVAEPYWAERSRAYAAAQEPWLAAPERQPEWREWRRTHASEVVTYAAPAQRQASPRNDDPRYDNVRGDNVRGDNGRHLGWDKQDKKADKAERREEDRFARAYTPAAAIVDVRGDDRGGHPGKGKGHDKSDKHDDGPGKGHDKGNGHGGDKGKGHGKD